MLLAFLFGLVFALGLILPLGPQNMFVLAQGMRNNHKSAIAAVVITAATCDTLLILIAGFGLTLVVFKLVWLKAIFLILGVCFLAYLGWSCWKQPASKAITENSASSQQSLKRLILITLGLSLLNPYALLDTLVTIDSMSLTYHDKHNRIIFLFACIMTSWIWFMGVALMGKQLNKLHFIRSYQGKISALVMWLASLYLLYMLLLSLL